MAAGMVASQPARIAVWRPAAASIVLSVLVALLIGAVHAIFPQNPEKAVLATGLLFLVLLAIPVGASLARSPTDLQKAALIFVGAAAVLLVSTYLYWVSFYVRFPADILIWSEGDFVNDIIKFSRGYPIFTAQANNESFTYVPGTQLLTYFLAWAGGKATSIPVYRAIQVGYSFLAALVATLCCRRIVMMTWTGGVLRYRKVWGALWVTVLFLIATNTLTNRFTHNLHDDALSELVSITAYYLLLVYIAGLHRRRTLVMMALLPAMGFFVKQSLMVWAGFFFLHLAFFDQPRSLRRLAVFAAGAFGSIAAVVAGCYAVWGEPFVYWTFQVLGKHGVSPLRGFDHVLQTWPYFAVGLAAGMLLLRGSHMRLLLSPWLVWISLISLEAYTSGIAWMLNHLGPGCLIAGVWFLAGLTVVWESWASRAAGSAKRPERWVQAGCAAALVSLIFSGFGVVRIPLAPVSADAYRYVNDIEREFAGQPSRDVLLDAGSWVYLKDGVVMKDRAPCIGERGYSETGDFSGILSRLRQKRYAKILVRDLHEPDFWYDHYLWPKSSGIREALLQNYHETGKIEAVSSTVPVKNRAEDPYLFSRITILEPNKTMPSAAARSGASLQSEF